MFDLKGAEASDPLLPEPSHLGHSPIHQQALLRP